MQDFALRKPARPSLPPDDAQRQKSLSVWMAPVLPTDLGLFRWSQATASKTTRHQYRSQVEYWLCLVVAEN